MKFYAVQHLSQESGYEGVILENWKHVPNADICYSPITLAHDVLEHVVPFDGTMENELMALGALIWGRGQMGCISVRQQVPVSDVKHEIARSIPLHRKLKKPPMTFRKLGECDELILEALEGVKVETPDSDYSERRLTAEEHKLAAGWLKYGAHLAQRRYKEPRVLNDLYWMLHNDLERMSPAGEFYRLLDGIYDAKLEISVCYKRCRVNVGYAYLGSDWDF